MVIKPLTESTAIAEGRNCKLPKSQYQPRSRTSVRGDALIIMANHIRTRVQQISNLANSGPLKSKFPASVAHLIGFRAARTLLHSSNLRFRGALLADCDGHRRTGVRTLQRHSGAAVQRDRASVTNKAPWNEGGRIFKCDSISKARAHELFEPVPKEHHS